MMPAESVTRAVAMNSNRRAQPFRLFNELVACHDIEIFVHGTSFETESGLAHPRVKKGIADRFPGKVRPDRPVFKDTFTSKPKFFQHASRGHVPDVTRRLNPM